jgi:hypothetical protein
MSQTIPGVVPAPQWLVDMSDPSFLEAVALALPFGEVKRLPVCLVPPVLEGTLVYPGPITIKAGTNVWDDPSATLAYLWGFGSLVELDDDENYVDTGETHQDIGSGDVGGFYRLRVGATNAAGTTSVKSAAYGPVVAPAPP